MMYETAKEVREPIAECEATEYTEAKPIAPTQEDTIDTLIQIHEQLSGLAEFLFGDQRELFDRPEIKCLEDSVLRGNVMTKYALERIIMIKRRLGA